MKLTLLFANGRPTPPITLGGDSASMYILLRRLSDRGHRCFAFGTLNPAYSTAFGIHDTSDIRKRLRVYNVAYTYMQKWWAPMVFVHDGFLFLAKEKSITYSYPIASRMVRTELFSKELDSCIRHIRPDVILTQIDNVPEVLAVAKKYEIPVFLIIQDMEPYNLSNIRLANAYMKTSVVCISDAVRKIFAHECVVPVYTWYHPFVIPNNREGKAPGEYITLVNPVFVKGGTVFHGIAKALPEYKFLAVTNWYDPKNDGIDFSDTPNVTVIPRQDDMERVYARTKLLLVPSLWQEAFGRVVVEAGMYGIPSVVSNTGGLPESVGNGGIVVGKYLDVGQWVAVIRHVLRPAVYKTLRNRAYAHALRFRADVQCKKFEDILRLRLGDLV